MPTRRGHHHGLGREEESRPLDILTSRGECINLLIHSYKEHSVIVVVLVLVIVLLIVALAFQPPKPDAVTKWAETYGVVVSEENRAVIERYVTRTRRVRFACAFLAWLAQGAVRSLVHAPIPWANSLIFLLAGYLI